MEHLIARADKHEKKAKKLPGWRLFAKKVAAKCDKAAHLYKEIAVLYKDQNKTEKAIEFFEKASKLFRKVSWESECYEKAAQLAADIEHYSKATDMFENIASYSLNDINLKHDVKGYLFSAGICRLCTEEDPVAMAKKYADSYPTFRDTWYCKSLKRIADSIDKRDLQMFRDEVDDLKSTALLDQWATNMLFRVEKKLEASMSGRTRQPTKALNSNTTCGAGGKQRKTPAGSERYRTTYRNAQVTAYWK